MNKEQKIYARNMYGENGVLIMKVLKQIGKVKLHEQENALRAIADMQVCIGMVEDCTEQEVPNKEELLITLRYLLGGRKDES